LTELAGMCDAVCFGSLAQRSAQTREAIRLFLRLAKDAIRFFDVNLRQNWYDTPTLLDSFGLASAIKLNVEELDVLVDRLGFPKEEGIHSFFHHFAIDYAVLTRGELGTVVYTRTDSFEGEHASYPECANADPVGAGDACAAAVTVGLLSHMEPQGVANVANRVGAFVASCAGATPELPPEILGLFRRP